MDIKYVPSTEKQSLDDDLVAVEKLASQEPVTYPEGGWKAWSVVLGVLVFSISMIHVLSIYMSSGS